MKTYDVVIATPASMLTAAYVRSLTNTIKILEEKGISWTYVNYESCYIRYARESIISYGEAENVSGSIPFAGFFNYKKIMWIDSDISWGPEDFLSLYYSERDIISGAYMTVNGSIAASIDGKNLAFPKEIPTTREVELQTCGFGFLCVKNGVFENMERPWFDSEIFERDGRTMTTVGEDNSWCVKAHRSGFKIWLDPKVRVVHNKTMPLVWSDTI
jgi:hypothetical protein